MTENKMVQADAGAPALSEKVNDRSEWLPIESAPRDGTHILAFGPQPGCNAREHGWTEVRETHFEHSGWDWYEAVHNCSHKWKPTHWMPLPSPPGAELNFSNEAGSDAVSLNQSLHHTQSKEG